MLKPVRMKKLNALILEENREAILRELKEGGMVQFMDVKETPILKGLGLEPGKTSWIRVDASEYLSKIDGILETFKLVEEGKGSSMIQQFIGREGEKVAVKEVPVEDLFDQVEEKLFALEEKVGRISSRLEQLKKEREELLNGRDVISKLEKFEVGPKDLMGFKSAMISLGTIPSAEIEKLKAKVEDITEHFFFYTQKLTKKDSLILVVALRKFEVDVSRMLRLHRFEEIRVPLNLSGLSIEEASNKIESELSLIKKEEGELLEDLKKLSDAESRNLLLMRESLQIEKFLDEANSLFGRTSRTYFLTGWVPIHFLEEVKGIIERVSDGCCIISLEDPGEDEKPPTLLSNPPQTEGLELLTGSYGVPDYHELDPTSVMAITFPLVFGLMFGDVGHGIMLAALGYFLAFKLEASKTVERLGKTLLLCGIFSTICGFFYGAIFGLEGIIHPLWKSPMHHITDAIVFALELGVALLILGCLLTIAKEVMHKKYAEAIVSPFGLAGIWLLLGGAYLVYTHGVEVIYIILALAFDMERFTLGILSTEKFLTSLKILAFPLIAPLLVMVIGEWKVTKISIFWSAFETYENLTRYLVNSISFVRVVILAIIHEALSSMMVMALSLIHI